MIIHIYIYIVQVQLIVYSFKLLRWAVVFQLTFFVYSEASQST